VFTPSVWRSRSEMLEMHFMRSVEEWSPSWTTATPYMVSIRCETHLGYFNRSFDK
jgi:hypothetical protein